MTLRVTSTSPVSSFKPATSSTPDALTEQVAKLWTPEKSSSDYWDMRRTSARTALIKDELALRALEGPYVHLFLNGAKDMPQLSSNAKLLLKLAGQLLDSGMTHEKSNQIVSNALGASQTTLRINPSNFTAFGAALRFEPLQDITDFVAVYFTTVNKLRSQKIIEAASTAADTLNGEKQIEMAGKLNPALDRRLEELSEIILTNLRDLAAPASDAPLPIPNIRLAKMILSLLTGHTDNPHVEGVIQAIEERLKIGIPRQVMQMLFTATNFYEPKSAITPTLMTTIYAACLLLLGNSGKEVGMGVMVMTNAVSQLNADEVRTLRAIFNGFGEADVELFKMLEPTFRDTILDISESVLKVKASDYTNSLQLPR